MTGRREALLIATSTYRDQRFQRLMAPLNDVRSLGTVFADPALGGFDVATVTNQDAHVIAEKIETFCLGRTPDDTILLYFSCHGFTSDTGDLFLIARDTDKDKLYSTGVADTFLRATLRRCRAQTRILILDCCFGGAFNTSLLAKGETDSVNIKATFAEAGSGLVVLTASNARESAFEEVGDGSQRKSVFTRTLVDGISTGEADLDGDGSISVDDLYTFATTRITTNQSLQTPTLTTIGVQGTIVIAKAKPRPVVARLEAAPGLGVEPTRQPDLRPWVRVHDTGPDGTNVAMSAVTAMETNLAYQGSPITLSARYIHQKAKQLAGVPEDSQGGVDWKILTRVVTEFGTVPEDMWPYRPGEWKVPEGKTMAELDAAAATYRARLTPVLSPAALIGELNSGRPVVSGFTVFESTWMSASVAKSGVIEPPKPDDEQRGVVAVTIVDVDQTAKLLRFAHTWGPSWGDRGIGTMSFQAAETMLILDEMWSVDVEVAGRRRFRWDLTDVPPPPGPGVVVRPPTRRTTSAPRPGRSPGGPHRPPRRPAADPPAGAGTTPTAPVTPATPGPGSTPATPTSDGLLRIVFDGRVVGASYANPDPATVLRQDGGKASTDPVANQVFDALGAFDAFLRDAFGRRSWDGQGGPYRAIVHYGRDYDNAFWDGGAQVVVLGDGDGHLLTGFYGLDVVAKELGNAVVGTMTSLTYEGQSGALFNAISLVIASMAKQHALGQSAADADWLIGAGLLADGIKGRALNDLLNPGTAYDDPGMGKDAAVGHLDQYLKTSADQGGIHVNSGIPARAFALAAVALGGPSWEQVGLAWYRAVGSPALPSRATFAAFAGLTVAGAPNVRAGDAIGAAWHQVGVTPAGH